jgi:hypothetical protein
MTRKFKKQIWIFCAGIAYGSLNTGAICYGWYKSTYASSPQAIIDTSMGGETVVRYVNGKAMELVFRPEIKPANGVKPPIVKK